MTSTEAKAQAVEHALASCHYPDDGSLPLHAGGQGNAPTLCGIYVPRRQIPFCIRATCLDCRALYEAQGA